MPPLPDRADLDQHGAGLRGAARAGAAAVLLIDGRVFAQAAAGCYHRRARLRRGADRAPCGKSDSTVCRHRAGCTGVNETK